MNLVGTMNNKDEKLLEKIIHLMERDDSENAPPDSVRWAKNLFAARAAEPKKSVVQKIMAVLQMDLSPQKPAFGERSASGAKARQMFFEAGEAGVDLRISESEKGFALHGQVLGAEFANCAVRIGAFETRAGELGEFKFMDLPAGIYDLTLQTGEKEIMIENLELK